MNQFLYSVGDILIQVLTLWLAIIGVILCYDLVVSKLCRRRNRQQLESLAVYLVSSTSLTLLALLAGSVDYYLITPALEAGVNFFFAG